MLKADSSCLTCIPGQEWHFTSTPNQSDWPSQDECLGLATFTTCIVASVDGFPRSFQPLSIVEFRSGRAEQAS
jgi:hypothetical protein